LKQGLMEFYLNSQNMISRFNQTMLIFKIMGEDLFIKLNIIQNCISEFNLYSRDSTQTSLI
jgi:hypothetical protein